MTIPEHLRLIENLNRTLDATETRIADRINRALARAFVELEEELRRKYPEYQAQGEATNFTAHSFKNRPLLVPDI